MVGGAEVKEAPDRAYRVVAGVGERLGREHLVQGVRPPLVCLIDRHCGVARQETGFDHQIAQFVLASVDGCACHPDEPAALPFGQGLDATEIDEPDSPVRTEAIVAGMWIAMKSIAVSPGTRTSEITSAHVFFRD